MAKEQVIVFEGEHLFVAPKNHVINKKTGMVYKVPSEMNVVAPIEGDLIEPPVKPLMQPDEPPIVTTTTTTEPILSRGGNAPQGGVGNVGTPLPSLGDPSILSKPIEESPVQQPLQTKAEVPTLPISFGSAPSRSGGGGGGGGAKEEKAAAKKTFLQKYWWLLVLAGVGGYIYYKRKK
jgi:hypothetical protein